MQDAEVVADELDMALLEDGETGIAGESSAFAPTSDPIKKVYYARDARVHPLASQALVQAVARPK